MEVAALSSNVVTSNLGSTTGFRMETNQFSFRVMSDGLYQNKIGSPVREYCCNAYDSHVAAGKADVPFEVHLPDAFNPMFYVQDYGLGLDDAGVRETFATYFRSTKRTNNEAVGAFGLGSKTAFAYTDAFQIIAVKDGKRRMFSAFINADGLPDISNMGGEFSAEYTLFEGEPDACRVLDQWDETSEENGVRIVIPVTKPSDFDRFRNEVKNQLAFFPVKPVILNYPAGIEWQTWVDSNNHSVTVDNISIGSYRYGGAFNGLWVVQGPVGYKADKELLKSQLSPAAWEALEVISECAILRFNLGEVEVTPSREGLSYSRKTLDAIEKLAESLRSSMRATIQAKIDAAPNAWAKALLINENETLRKMATASGAGFEAPGYYRTSGMYYVSLQKIADFDNVEVNAVDNKTFEPLSFNTEWKGVNCEDEVSLEDEETEETEDDGIEALKRYGLEFVQYSKKSIARRSNLKKWREGDILRHAKVETYFNVIAVDTSDKPVVRMREWLEDCYSGATVLKLRNRDGSLVTDDQIAMVTRAFDGLNIKRLSDVEPPKREGGGTRAGYRAPKAYTWNVGDSMDETTDWEREYDKLSEFDGAYYVEVERNRIVTSRRARVVYYFARAGLLDKPIMAIRRKDIEKLANNPDWVSIDDKADEIIASVTSNPTFINARRASAYSNTGTPKSVLDSTVYAILKDACAEGRIHEDSPLHAFFNVTKLYDRVMARAVARGWNDTIASVFAAAGIDAEYDGDLSRKLSARANAKNDAPLALYPMLRFIGMDRHTYDTPESVADNIVAYVNSHH